MSRTEGDSTQRYVTIKININTLTSNFLKGRKEIAQKLASKNPNHPGYKHVRFMQDTFKVKSRNGEHLCIVYDVLREPIHLCMEKFPSRLFNTQHLRLLLPGLLQGLDYLHDECRVVHTDLKADNIMMGLGDPAVLDRFVQYQIDHPTPRKMRDSHGRIIYKSCSDFGDAPDDAVISSAKITDIGLAVWGDERHNGPIQSNAFTAPEVILAAGWSYPADIWNLGVMLWDLFENFGLFDAIDTRPSHYHSDQHLGLMIALMGPPPHELLERGSTSATYFDEHGNFRQPKLIPEGFSFESSITRLKGEDKAIFIDFIKKMITWLPEDRWTAKQLLDHPWLSYQPSRDDYPLKSREGSQYGTPIPSGAATPKSTASVSKSAPPSLTTTKSNASAQELIDAILKKNPHKDKVEKSEHSIKRTTSHTNNEEVLEKLEKVQISRHTEQSGTVSQIRSERAERTEEVVQKEAS